VLTTTRIISSFILLCTKPFSLLFFIFYIFCGVSDIADGYIARKIKCTSQFGAILDSLADVIFIGSTLIIFIPMFKWPLWTLWWIGLIALIRLISLIVGFVKYHSIALLHTYANKATGFLLFCFPLLYYSLNLTISTCLVCVIGSISAVEELLINKKSQSLSRNVKSIFSK